MAARFVPSSVRAQKDALKNFRGFAPEGTLLATAPGSLISVRAGKITSSGFAKVMNWIQRQRAARTNSNRSYNIARYKAKTSYTEKQESLNLGLTNTDKLLGVIKEQNKLKKEGRRRESLRERGKAAAVFGASGVTGGSAQGAQRDLAKTIELNNAMQASIDNERVVRAEAEKSNIELSQAQVSKRLKNLDKEIMRQKVPKLMIPFKQRAVTSIG